ncbi:hypothetical protein CXB51_003816 [Gossypium anomalum]|uniref:Sieve element occlusion N-terminal domain-containing protein n=1 Tax=Gossypium anomalum TaxID=47600 RepID=A0A8J5ZH96_9ROSI|nr:hypothetical protein CXB51_003816 [Gossypium anomalum]
MDQQKKTTSGALQAPLTAPTNNPTAAAQALLHNPGATQALANNSGAAAAAQAFLGNRGATYQPLLNNTYVGQQHMGVSSGSISKPSTGEALMKGHSGSHALIRSDRGSMLSLSNDNVMMNQILATHAPNGREFDVRPLLNLVEDIRNRATQHVDFLIKGTTQAQIEMEEKALQENHIAILEAFTYTIDRIAYELSYKAFVDSDAHATTTAVFNLLSSYTWDAKLVLSLSAFALNYGEFWLLAQIYSTNHLPNVTKCVVQFTQLPSTYISQDVPVLVTAMNLFPTIVYWTIRSMVACVTQISNLSSMGHEFGISTTESWELSTLAHKLRNIYELLRQQLNLCYQYIEEKTDPAFYQVSLDVLRRKNVLLLISSFEFARDELAILEQIYNESRIHATRLESQSEFVWIPIVDYSIILLLEEMTKPILVVLDLQGKEREHVKKVIGIINVEKLSYAWQDLTTVWFFWTRLESMLFSKVQLGRDDGQDPMMQQIKKLISYDREGGWAVLSRGSDIVVNGHSTTVLPALGGYDE